VKSQSYNLSEIVEGMLLQKECIESKNSNTWSVFEEVPQGVHIGIFPKGLEDFSIKLKRDRIFEAVEENLRRFSTLKHSRGGVAKLLAGRYVPVKEYRVHFARVVKEALDG
jgi:hypothetical protein